MRRARLALGWIVTSLACTASDVELAHVGDACFLDSDCAAPLVCVFQRCHEKCSTSADCPAGQRCLIGDPPVHVCQLDDERACARTSDCPAPLVCGVDQRCRDACHGDRDCLPGQVCASATCADPSELGPDGELEPQGDGLGAPCTLTSDCATASLVCVAGACEQGCDDPSACTPPAVCAGGYCHMVPCVPNAQSACVCPDGQLGAQLCQADGELGPCLGCASGSGGSGAGGGGQGGAGGGQGGAGGGQGGGGGGGPLSGDTLAAKGFGVESMHVATDAAGNLFVGGSYSGVQDVGCGAMSSQGASDVFVARVDPADFACLALAKAGSTQADAVSTLSARGGRVAVWGTYGGTIDFGQGALPAGPGLFIAVYDTALALQFARGIPASGSPFVGTQVALDAVGGVTVQGNLASVQDLGGGVLAGPGMFIAHYDAAGAPIWAKTFLVTGGNSLALIYGLALDANGSIVASGYFRGVLDVGAGPMTSMNMAAESDAWLGHFDASGNADWSKSFGTTLTDTRAGPVASRGTGVVLTAGFVGTVDFGGGPLTSTNATYKSVVVAAYDGLGTHQWSKRFGGAVSNAEPTGVATDSTGAVLASGLTQDSIDFGGGLLVPHGQVDQFIVKLDAAGSHLWSRMLGGTGIEFVSDLTVLPNDEVVVGLQELGGPQTIDFGTGALSGSAFLARLAP